MMGFGIHGLGMLPLIVFWIVVVALALWLLSRLFPRPVDDFTPRDERPAAGSTESALEVLKKRYASGEISRGEYERVRRDLRD
jgi:putative membrane protein